MVAGNYGNSPEKSEPIEVRFSLYEASLKKLRPHIGRGHRDEAIHTGLFGRNRKLHRKTREASRKRFATVAGRSESEQPGSACAAERSAKVPVRRPGEAGKWRRNRVVSPEGNGP
ncbi:hypothetical protein RchiOBHm_Chr2g0131421 [Rosa chinensis]|uniref:Uncharacterized protein n=1 Tax=Rosa chinensis TaxID=74649 RepID=A0A2P6RV21_ROSCH|nr:hypothetical protein RchiOBHm_Chr2g0131421 [Rosa chinensis]